jgi:hypothetical protein
MLLYMQEKGNEGKRARVNDSNDECNEDSDNKGRTKMIDSENKSESIKQ